MRVVPLRLWRWHGRSAQISRISRSLALQLFSDDDPIGWNTLKTEGGGIRTHGGSHFADFQDRPKVLL
jgi:hypothetical protein